MLTALLPVTVVLCGAPMIGMYMLSEPPVLLVVVPSLQGAEGPHA